jgi:tape measure domain-containing protein
VATTAVDIVVKVTGQRSLDKITSSVKKSENAINNLDAKLRGPLNSSFQKAGTAGQAAANKIKNAFRGAAKDAESLGKRLGGLRAQILGLGVGASLGKSFIDASDLESANTRIDNLVKNFSQFTGIQDVATQSAQKFRLSQVEALSALTDLGNRLGGTGASLKDIENIFEGFNTLLVNNKVEAQQAASAQLQLNQALGSGRLAGEEFNAINEATPQLLNEVARVLNVQRGELKKLASEGKISSQTLIQALTNIRTQGAADLESAFSGSFGALRKFNVALKEFSTTVGQELLPVITPLLEEATKLLKLFGELPEPVRKAAVGITLVGTAAVFAIPLITATAGALVKVAAAIGTLKLGAAAAGVSKLALAFTGLKAAVAFLTGPVGLLVAGVVGVGTAAFVATNKINQFNNEINKTTNSSSETEKQIALVEGRLQKLQGELAGSGNSARGLRRQVEELKAKLEQLKGTYKVQIEIETLFKGEGATFEGIKSSGFGKGEQGLTYTVAGITYDARTGRPLVAKPKQLPKPPVTTTGGGSSGGGGAAPKPQDDTKQAESLLRSLVQTNNLLLTRSQIEKDILSTQFELEDTLERINELQGISPQLRQQLETQANVLAVNKENTIALDAATAAAADIFQLATDTLTPLNQQKRLLEAQLNGNAQQVQDQIEIENAVKGLTPELAEQVRLRLEGIQALRQEVEATKELDDLYQGIGNTIENGIISAIDAGINSLVDGTKSLDEALKKIASGVLKDIGNQLIRFGINAAFSSLGNSGGFLGKLFGGGRAEGGSVSPDKTFLVGEKGPELFTPSTNGTILPNDFFDSARAALQPSGGDSAASDNPEAFAAAAAAIQRNTTNISNRQSAISQETSFNNFAETLGSQQRETIRFETVRVGEMDMVTKDEALKIGAESAKAAEASVFNALKNKPSVRKSIGMS